MQNPQNIGKMFKGQEKNFLLLQESATAGSFE